MAVAEVLTSYASNPGKTTMAHRMSNFPACGYFMCANFMCATQSCVQGLYVGALLSNCIYEIDYALECC